MKNAFAQLKKEQTSAKNSQTPAVDNKKAKGDLLYSKLREESAKERGSNPLSPT
jgi:hypothetical protein